MPSSLRSKILTLTLALAILFTGAPVRSAEKIRLSDKEMTEIGRKVWRNECGGTVEGLTSWNAGEDFASLGIGHFIWYPKGARGPFEESFPKLIDFLAARGARVPDWTHGPCPWATRADFQRELKSTRMTGLRELLVSTVPLQTEFLIQRLEGALPKMLEKTSPANRDKVRERFYRVMQSGRGAYALIDYVNFKGEGTLETERYKGEGWGLLQVLEGMKGTGDPVADFAESAQSVLTRRVQNAPPARNESRWLPGWKSRVAGYAK